MKKTEPTVSLLQGMHYTPADRQDVRSTWARFAKEYYVQEDGNQAQAEDAEQEEQQ